VCRYKFFLQKSEQYHFTSVTVANTTKGMSKLMYDPSDSIIFLTNRVGRLLAHRIRCQNQTAEHARVLPHIGILVDLWAKDGVRQQDLAVSLIKDKGTIARALNFMEENDLVVRITDDQDKRNKRIYLTHKGRMMQTTLKPLANEALQTACADIPEDKITTCKEVLQQMYENLQK